MPIGDWRYHTRVPREIRQQAAAAQFGDPEWFVPALEAPAQYPESARDFLAEATRRLVAEAPDLVEPGDRQALKEYDSEAKGPETE
jgi:hypothetical protein